MPDVSQSIHQVAARTPQAIALSSGDAQLTFAELDEAASRLAGHLNQLGVGCVSVVPLVLERSFDQIIAALAVMRAGAAYLPLDATWPDHRIRAILTDAGAELFIAPAELADRLNTGVRSLCLDREQASIAQAPGITPAPLPLDSLAYVIYTSGSTGAPKGVEITHDNLRNLIEWHIGAFSVTERSRASHIAGLGFDAAVWEIWPYLAAGACVQLPGTMDDLIRTSPAHLLHWLHDGHITHAFVPTALAEPIIQSAWPETTLVRCLLTGGDALRRNPIPGLPFTVYNNYGPSECTVVTTSTEVKPAGALPPPIGHAIRGAFTYVLDTNRQPVVRGQIGELYVGGAGVGRGYRNLPQQIAAAFLPDPFRGEPGARMYRTGDLVSESVEGELEFHGRSDGQQKIRGQRLELEEVEAVLEQCAGVLFNSVVTQLDDDGEKYLLAYILPDENSVPSVRDIKEFLGQRLPAAMIPSQLVRLKTLPLNSSGKLDLSLLPSPADQNPWMDDSGDPHREAANDLEASILATVQGLLGDGKCGLDDDFFLSGGHSLLGAQLVTRLRSNYGIALTLRDLFEAPTPALLAVRVEELILAQIEQMSDDEAEAAL